MVEAVCAGWINGDLGLLHLADGCGLESFAAEDGFEEDSVIACGGAEGAGDVAFICVKHIVWGAVGLIAFGGVGSPGFAPDVATLGHAEGDEDLLTHYFFDGLMSDGFDGLLQVDHALAGVTEALAGCEVDG